MPTKKTSGLLGRLACCESLAALRKLAGQLARWISVDFVDFRVRMFRGLKHGIPRKSCCTEKTCRLAGEVDFSKFHRFQGQNAPRPQTRKCPRVLLH